MGVGQFLIQGMLCAAVSNTSYASCDEFDNNKSGQSVSDFVADVIISNVTRWHQGFASIKQRVHTDRWPGMGKERWRRERGGGGGRVFKMQVGLPETLVSTDITAWLK